LEAPRASAHRAREQVQHAWDGIGFNLIVVASLLSTASAINATLYGTARPQPVLEGRLERGVTLNPMAGNEFVQPRPRHPYAATTSATGRFSNTTAEMTNRSVQLAVTDGTCLWSSRSSNFSFEPNLRRRNVD
jgi:hypothetical protein